MNQPRIEPSAQIVEFVIEPPAASRIGTATCRPALLHHPYELHVHLAIHASASLVEKQ